MAKDPAFLFYSSDFLTGTITMTDEQVGKYVRLLCHQHQKGVVTAKDMKHYAGGDPEVISKFEALENGHFINRRLAEVMQKRRESAEKTKERIKKFKEKQAAEIRFQNVSKTFQERFCTETENEIENENIRIGKGGVGERERIGLEPVVELAEQFLGDPAEVALACKLLGILPDAIPKHMKVFLAQLEYDKVKFKTESDFRTHFANFTRKKINNGKGTTSTSGINSSARIEPVSDFTQGWKRPAGTNRTGT